MEVWMDLQGYEGTHQVSNMGNVRSLTRSIPRANGRPLNLKGRTLKQFKDTRGYLCVQPNSGKTLKVHRIVAEHFIPNPDNKPQVNHKNGNKDNNKADNLEWVTNRENFEHAVEHNLHRIEGMLESNQAKRIPVRQLTLDGEVIQVFDSMSDAAKAVGSSSSKVSMCCRGHKKQQTVKGFKFEFVQEPCND